MLLHHIKTKPHQINTTAFKGDKTVLNFYRAAGLREKDRLLSEDIYLKREEIEENIFIDKILNKSSSNHDILQDLHRDSFRNCFLITGDPGTGKSTFMLKIAKMLEDRGVKTILYKNLDNFYNPTHSKSLYDIEKYLKTCDKTVPIVIFLDEFHYAYEEFIKLVQLTHNLSNAKLVCTAPLETYNSKAFRTDWIPNNNVLVLENNRELKLKFINSSLKAAGFQDIPKKFEDKILKMIDEKGLYRWIIQKLYLLISTEMDSNNDVNTIEAIPDSIWGKI